MGEVLRAAQWRSSKCVFAWLLNSQQALFVLDRRCSAGAAHAAFPAETREFLAIAVARSQVRLCVASATRE